MTRFLSRGWLVGTIALGAIVAPALADGAPSPAGDATDDKVARLEALLDAQQRRISQLEQQVSAASEGDQDKARVDAMKQQIREVLSEREFRESLMPSIVTAGYEEGKGFYINSGDEKFRMNFSGYMQTRWTHYGTQSRNRYLNPRLERDDRTGFDMQRIRFTIDGYAWTKDLTYNITLRADGPDANDVRIHYAYAAYRFADEFQFQAGTYQLSGTRSQLEANDGFALVDRGLVDAVFGFGNGTGVRFFGHLFEKKLSWYLDVVNSLNGQDNRTITPDPAEHDNNPAVIFRSVWHAMGENNLADFAIESDVRKDKTQPALDIGIFSYGFNDDRGDLGTTRIPFARPDRGRGVGGYGLTTTNGLQIHQFWWDVAFKYMGFSAQSEYVLRVVDPRHAFRRPFTPWSLLSGDDSTTAQHGAYAQVAYFLPIPGMENKVEVAARISGISALSERQEGSWEYSAGVNYYPLETHKVKLQTDFAKIYEVPISSSYSSYANVNDDALFFRVQLQVGF